MLPNSSSLSSRNLGRRIGKGRNHGFSERYTSNLYTSLYFYIFVLFCTYVYAQAYLYRYIYILFTMSCYDVKWHVRPYSHIVGSGLSQELPDPSGYVVSVVSRRGHCDSMRLEFDFSADRGFQPGSHHAKNWEMKIMLIMFLFFGDFGRFCESLSILVTFSAKNFLYLRNARSLEVDVKVGVWPGLQLWATNLRIKKHRSLFDSRTKAGILAGHSESGCLLTQS